MQLIRKFFFLAGTLAFLPITPAFSHAQPELPTVWKCPQADGTLMYTNKEKSGCESMVLRPLSVVPDLESMPTSPMTFPTRESRYETSPSRDRDSMTGGRQVPDWARDWHANNTASGSVQAEACTLYMEWMQLVQKTRGGMFFGSDPSYGGDLTGRNQRGASHSFYDNARYIALSRLFGTGFVPIGCF